MGFVIERICQQSKTEGSYEENCCPRHSATASDSVKQKRLIHLQSWMIPKGSTYPPYICTKKEPLPKSSERGLFKCALILSLFIASQPLSSSYASWPPRWTLPPCGRFRRQGGFHIGFCNDVQDMKSRVYMNIHFYLIIIIII